MAITAMQRNTQTSRDSGPAQRPKRTLGDDKVEGVAKKNRNLAVNASDVTLKRMAAKKFTGWKILFKGDSCGTIKFLPKEDTTFGVHVTVDVLVRKNMRGLHIGRTALQLSLEETTHQIVVAHLRKTNTPSKKMLSAVGFQETEYPESRQLCMIFRKADDNISPK